MLSSAMLGRSMLSVISPSDPDYQERLANLGRRTAAMPAHVELAAKDIVAQVRAEGDAALKQLTQKFEKRSLESIELSRADWDAALTKVSSNVMAALEVAAARIRNYHERERYHSFEFESEGVRLGCRFTPLDRAGIYVPGGKALYPSTVLMTAIPAKVAGVREVLMVTPGPSPEALAAAKVAGVDRIFHIGGAQAIAALAYGTQTVPRVDKIVGPGNAYVTAAKRLVFGDVGIDSIAGPTEIVVVADSSVPAAWVAADLLAQAEHDELAAPILIAIGKDVALAVCAEIELQLVTLPRRAIAERSVKDWGLAIVVGSAAQAIDLVNLLAPEHAELAMQNARELAQQVTRAGAVFIGSYTPESVGDYIAGPSHVLPTGGSARFSSPLGVGDFVKRTSMIEYSAQALAAQAPHIIALTEAEGLDAHGRAVTVRLD